MSGGSAEVRAELPSVARPEIELRMPDFMSAAYPRCEMKSFVLIHCHMET